MNATRRTALAATAAAFLLLVGCGSDSEGTKASTTGSNTTGAPGTDGTDGGGDGTTGSTAATTATTEAGGSTETTESSEGRDTDTSELDNLSDGDHIGTIAGVENGVVEGQDVQVILFDPAEVLTGQAAIDAAAEDGVELDTDYYVRDPDASLVRIAVAPDAQVSTLAGGSADPVPSSVTEIGAAGDDILHTINTSTVRDVTLVNSISGYYLA